MEHEKRVEQLVGPAADGHPQKDQVLRKIQRSCRDARMRLDKCLHEYRVYETVDGAVNYLTSRPLLLISVVAAVSAIAIPVLIFTVFAITTVICTFTGFVVIEGTILAFGTIVLCGVLLSIITSIMMLGACVAAAYYISLQLYSVIKKI